MEKSVARVRFEDLDDCNGESSASEAEPGRGVEENSSGEEESDQETRKMVARQNRKGKKSGGFQSMGIIATYSRSGSIFYPVVCLNWI